MTAPLAPKAFVTGSTGYVGQAVVAELGSRDLGIVAHIRPDSRRLADLGPRFESLGAELCTAPWDVGPLTEALHEHAVTHVFCLIGTTRKQAAAEGLGGNIYERVDLGLTKLLVEAATKVEHTPRFIYLSSIGASAQARSGYLKARGQAENAVASSGLPYVIARPSFITGSDRDEARPAERIGAAIADGALSAIGALGGKKLKAKYESTTASELATRLVERALGDDTGIFEGASLQPIVA